jgi:hypothetical protein
MLKDRNVEQAMSTAEANALGKMKDFYGKLLKALAPPARHSFVRSSRFPPSGLRLNHSHRAAVLDSARRRMPMSANTRARYLLQKQCSLRRWGLRPQACWWMRIPLRNPESSSIPCPWAAVACLCVDFQKDASDAHWLVQQQQVMEVVIHA